MRDTVLFLARADLWRGLRAKETLIWTFLMPLLFFFFFSRMGGGGGGRGDAAEPLRLEQGAEAGFLADEIARRLDEQGYAVERVAADASQQDGQASDARRVLEVPARLTERALDGQPSQLRLRRDASGLGGSYDDFRVGRAVYTVLADLAAVRAQGREPSPAAFAELAAHPRALGLEVRPAGARREIPTGREQSIPGMTVMFTLLVLLTSGCVPLVLERRAGLLRRLASAPIARWELVAGRWLSTFALGLVQVGYAMLAGTLVFGMDWGPRAWAVALVLVPWVALVASLALVLGCLARTESQVVGIGVLSANVLAALGGCWWPIEITPAWMQGLARLLPTGWIMEPLHALISFQAEPSVVLPQVVVMLVGAVVAAWGGARLFRYE